MSAFRDATLLKVAYSFGLRRTETRMLDVADFGLNPHGPEFGEYGVVYVTGETSQCVDGVALDD